MKRNREGVRTSTGVEQGKADTGTRPASAEGYGDDAEETARRYEAVAFEVVHDDFLPWRSRSLEWCIDVRIGTGLVGEERLAVLEAECTRLVALGAVRLRLLPADDVDESTIVMQDIEANEFCLD